MTILQKVAGFPGSRGRGFAGWPPRCLRGAAIGLAAAGALLVGLGVWIRCGPLPEGLTDRAASVSTVVLDRHGEVLYEARSADGTRGEWIAPDAIPQVVAAATLAAEDRRFRSHLGLDPIAIARAAWRNVRAGAILEGGSTISQQVAQLLLARRSGGAPRRGGWWAQLTEAVLALRLEHRMGKDEILALYLNLAPYGNQMAGIERAARAYFGTDTPALTAAEAAFLAALPQQPTRYNPWRDVTAAVARQRRILRTMTAEGWLDPGSYRAALGERLALRHEAAAWIAPHFVERVLAEATGRTARIDTTLDATLQRAAQGIIAARRADLEAHGAANIALVVLDNRRGEWLAWEGSGNYGDTARGGAIDGVISPRQPGSALKPFTYAAAFERGAHPGTVLADVPSQFPTIEPGILYSPRNYDGRFRGPMRARDALAGSENVPAVALAASVGVPVVARLLRTAGLTTLDHNADHYGLGLTLGNAEVRLDELVSAYAAFARGGVTVRPRKVRTGDDVAGSDSVQRVMASRTAFWIADILSDAEARSYTFGRGGALEFPFTVAAKTGTSQAYHDNWAIGFTRDVTVGVWVGNFDRRPLRSSSGVTGAGPILHDLLLAAVSRVRGALPIGDFAPIVAPTPDVRHRTVCAVSGMIPTTSCVRRVSEWVPVDEPHQDCTWHHQSERGLVTIWPDVYRHWARGEGLLDDGRAAAAQLAAGQTNAAVPGLLAPPTSRPSAAELTIAAPLAGATYLIDPTLRPEFQTLALQARGAPAGTSLEWRVNGIAVGSIDASGTLRWPLARGRHVIAVHDASGRRAETAIDVR